jgi:hypothetical protein
VIESCIQLGMVPIIGPSNPRRPNHELCIVGAEDAVAAIRWGSQEAQLGRAGASSCQALGYGCNSLAFRRAALILKSGA